MVNSSTLKVHLFLSFCKSMFTFVGAIMLSLYVTRNNHTTTRRLLINIMSYTCRYINEDMWQLCQIKLNNVIKIIMVCSLFTILFKMYVSYTVSIWRNDECAAFIFYTFFSSVLLNNSAISYIILGVIVNLKCVDWKLSHTYDVKT